MKETSTPGPRAPLQASRAGVQIKSGRAAAGGEADMTKTTRPTKAGSALSRRSFMAATAGAASLPLFNIKASASQTVTIQIAASHPVQNMWVAQMKNTLQPEVDRILRDGGNQVAISWKEAYGGTLYKFTDTMEAVRDNITDIGFVGSLWEVDSMPMQNITYFTPGMTGDHGLVARTFHNLQDTNPQLKAAWNRLNMVPLTALVTDDYHLWTNFPVTKLEDLRNRKINCPGTVGNWLQGTGATPVDGALTTYYTNIQTGVTEGAMSFFVGLLPTRVHEVAKYVTKLSMGAMYVGAIAANKTVFDKWPKPVQDAMMQARQTVLDRQIADISARVGAAEAEMVSKGAIVSTLPAAERQKLLAALPNLAQTWVQQSGSGSRELLQAFNSAVRGAGQAPARDWLAGLATG
jgi:TRAP-type C4-dicarboxylate transport system substrate-binding protein